MADAVTATKKKYMNFKEIAAYSLGLFGFQAIVGLLNSYQAEFDGSILGANVSVVAILILVAKIVSAVADPVVGNLIDRSKSKRGKFKSMILYSLVPLLVMTAVVFVKVPFSGTGLYVWIFLTYLVWSIAMTMGDVPSQGIASVLTPDPTERTNVVSISNTFKQIGFFCLRGDCADCLPDYSRRVQGVRQVRRDRYAYDRFRVLLDRSAHRHLWLCALCPDSAAQ